MRSDDDQNGAGPATLASDAPRDNPRGRWRGAIVSARGIPWRIASLAQPACAGWRWVLSAAVVGAAPFLVSFALGLPGHQALSAVLLSALCLACVRDDAWQKGVAVMAIAFFAHSAAVISLAANFPQRTVMVLPDAEAYWQKQITWIETGRDPEYELSAWVPAHLQLLGGSTLYSFTSLGALTFFQGFYEVDLMNYYNAQLMRRSKSRPMSLMLGWHLWSVLRGVGYLFITFEVISLSLQCISGMAVSTWRARRRRWAWGLGFLLADGLVKAAMLETVRSGLWTNLS